MLQWVGHDHLAQMIKTFAAKYEFLSNFHKRQLTWEGISYPTTEHAFQAAKTTDHDSRLSIAAISTPGRAKRAGRKVQLRDNWETIKVDVMASVLDAKFRQNPDLRDKLLSTGSEELVEGNRWGDRCWGAVFKDDGTYDGANHLGKCLMALRYKLRSERDHAASTSDESP